MLTKTKLETASKDDIPQCIPTQPEFNCHIEKESTHYQMNHICQNLIRIETKTLKCK